MTGASDRIYWNAFLVTGLHYRSGSPRFLFATALSLNKRARHTPQNLKLFDPVPVYTESLVRSIHGYGTYIALESAMGMRYNTC